MVQVTYMILLSFLLQLFFIETIQYVDNILKIMEEFDVKHPFIIHSNHFHTKLIRHLFRKKQYTGNLKNLPKTSDTLEYSYGNLKHVLKPIDTLEYSMLLKMKCKSSLLS